MAVGPQMPDDIDDAVAVIGLSLKFPSDADSPDSYWSMLERGECVMSEWPKDRLTLDAFYHRDHTADEKVCRIQGPQCRALTELCHPRSSYQAPIF